MKPTIQWMKQTFDVYNRKYFKGELREPEFSLDCPQGNWGFYMPDGTFNRITRNVKLFGPGTIFLSTVYSRTEKDLINTLLHEMIHMYIITVSLKYPLNQHGTEFQEWANYLNQFGWNISEYNEKQTTDILDNENNVDNNETMVNPYIFCIIEQPNDKQYKLWGFRADYNNLKTYMSSVKKLKKYGAAVLNIYYCYASNMKKIPIASQDLNGIGATNYNELIDIISRIIGEKITNKNFTLYKSFPI